MAPEKENNARSQFERWVDLFGSELYHTCLRRVRGRASLAEELLHETYLIAWQKLETFSGDDESARRWLHKIAYNLTPKVWRKNPDSTELSPELLERFLIREQGDDPLDPREVAGLKRCFEGIEPVDQAILQMRFGLKADPELPDTTVHLTWAEIAEQLIARLGGLFQTDQVRIRASRALTRLRKCLVEAGISE